jgi:DNA-3-methyladenine glycosylase I
LVWGGLTVRCFGDGDPLYAEYHDLEWGRPVLDEQGLYERICLEGFQAGLTWRLILSRRPLLRQAFAGFRPDAVAGFTAADIEAILALPGMIRHRGKVAAAVDNARSTLALRSGGLSLAEVVWAHRPPAAAPRSPGTPPPARTEASAALARCLRGHGFRFIGPTNAYALMQASGLVNDHGAGCAVHDEVAAAQTAAAARMGLCPAG